MRSYNFYFTFAAVAGLLLAVSTEGYAQSLNTVILAKVQGNVVVRDSAGASKAASNGDRVSPPSYIVTGPQSSVTLLFSNGSTVSVNENSSMEVSQFFQDAHGDKGFINQKGEPSRSTTRLKLDYGEIIGSTKKLNSASTYEISTPVGIVGIRGTDWYSKVLRVAEGIIALFGVLEGQVEFTPTGKIIITIGDGKQVEIKLTQEAGQPPELEVSPTTNIPADVMDKIKAIVKLDDDDLIAAFRDIPDEGATFIRGHDGEWQERVTNDAGE